MLIRRARERILSTLGGPQPAQGLRRGDTCQVGEGVGIQVRGTTSDVLTHSIQQVVRILGCTEWARRSRRLVSPGKWGQASEGLVGPLSLSASQTLEGWDQTCRSEGGWWQVVGLSLREHGGRCEVGMLWIHQPRPIAWA